ncbi:methyltransferase domain-containing protein [Patescibacteria group bacterium]|nr:methyltransferase domain-containing protein [Patescibacteria group bacterium]
MSRKAPTNDNEIYERHTLLSVILDIFFIPILNSRLFSVIARKFISTSGEGSEAKKHASHYQSMEVIYGFDHKLHLERGFKTAVADYVAQHFRNPRALRNRLQLIKRQHKEYIAATDKKELTILNLGTGSSRSIFETVLSTKNKMYKIILVDKNPKALSFSKTQAKELGVPHKIYHIQDDIQNISVFAKDLAPEIIEMAGLLEYIKDDAVITLLNDIFAIMPPGGLLITSNINYNREMKFVEHIMEWPLIYRDEDALRSIIARSSFNDAKASILYEPLHIHAVLLLRK